MKTNMIALFAASLLAVAAGSSCNVEICQVAVPITINGGAPDTKTAISGTTPTWKSGDKVTVVYTNTSDEVTTAKSAALGSDTAEAAFSVTLYSPKTAVDAYAYYPANNESATASSATLVIPGRQAPTGSSFDGAADILISKAFTPSGSVSTQFRRLGAVLKVKVSSPLLAGDYLKKLVLTADSPLAGKVAVDLESGTATVLSSGSNSVVAEYSASTKFQLSSAEDYIYLIVYPQTLAAGSHLSIAGETDNATFSKDIVLPSDIVLSAGHIQPLNISVTSVNRKFFAESFGGTDSSLTGDSASLTADNDGWSFTNGYAAGSGGHSARLGVSGSKGIATTPSIAVPSAFRGKTLKLSFKAAAWNYASEQTTLAVSASGTGVSLSGAALSSGKVSTVKGSWTSYELDIATTASTASLTLTFQGVQDSYARFFLDEVLVYYGSPSYVVVDEVPAYVSSLPQYLNCYEIPAVALADPSSYTNRGTETFGSTYWYEYDTENAKQKIVTHTYEYNSSLYRNYTYLIDQDKRCALWTAYPMHKTAYPNNDIERGSFSTSTSYDPAVPRSWQSSGSTDDYVEKDKYGYARGHHCASEDRQANSDANNQTFYYTNQSPQWQFSFNAGVWSSLEGAIQSNAPTGRDTLYVVVGTIFDPLNMHASNDGGEVARPSHYYKLLMKCSFNAGGDMTAASGVAYLYTNEAHSGCTYNDATFRKSIDYIESLTGFNFFANVPAALQTTAETQTASLW